jgi:hypothetical protein
VKGKATMAKTPLILTDGEQHMLSSALDQAIASAKRGQNTSRQTDFKALHQKMENDLQILKAKIIS